MAYLDIYQEYLKLEPAGAEYRAVCPFHEDHEPSFFINPNTGQYYCFGCQAQGDVFTFLQKFLNISFPEACVIAKKYGIEPLQKQQKDWKPKREPKPSKEEIQKIIELVEGKPKPKIYSAKEILSMDFSEPLWTVQNLIPQGVSLLAGLPKIGKSWMALNVAIAVATGGKALGTLDVINQGNVLYLALEDTPRRLQNRLDVLTEEEVEGLYFLFYSDVPKTKEGSTDWETLKALIKDSQIKLLIVDTFIKLRGGIANKNIYAEDYSSITPLKSLGDELGIAILILSHLKKKEEEDFILSVSGSTGLVGAVDTILVLERKRGENTAILHVTGRDVEEEDLALTFDQILMTWRVEGKAEDVQRSRERREIIDLLAREDREMTSKEIAEKLGKNYEATRMLLTKMVEAGDVIRKERGRYIVRKHIF